ncbi:anosmin-1 isoform X2 [Drosophila gunungcola]|uniref:anosmin-1 isoform X2 n=1 Tax=Drosophila gunungcola TaxID=103775 RepID=UPI0022E45844|nr:anosmin-1 isoform X2 [Drosophila gunungcola]
MVSMQVALLALFVLGQLSSSAVANGSAFSTSSSNQLQRQKLAHWFRDSNDVKDKILELQCLAKCGAIPSTKAQREQCLDKCIQELLLGPRAGSCPKIGRQTRVGLSCLDSCQYDHECPEVQKCCASSCGPMCVDALGVRNNTQLPPIPKILYFRRSRGHGVDLKIESSLLVYYFHVEVRSHIVRLFAPRKFGPWEWQKVEKTMEENIGHSKHTYIFFHMRPGRWYEVRVAAVNAYGFRGYSEPSDPFPSTGNPKPPKPPNDAKIIAKQFDGRYMNVKLVWCPSKSNLPVEKYKVTWSLYVNSKQASMITLDTYVKDLEIKKLLPNSSYYIQVQAISYIGSRRLKSEKKSMLFNTTLQPLEPITPLQCTGAGNRRRHHHISSSTSSEWVTTPAPAGLNEVSPNIANRTAAATYEVGFRLNRKFGMIVQILGFQPHKEKVYELCPQETNCEQREFRAIRAKRDPLEFSKLKYNTTYVLRVPRSSPNSVLDDSRNVFTFTTPKCENFRKRFPKLQIKCSD